MVCELLSLILFIGMRNRSPRDMYLFSFLHDGLRGLDTLGPPAGDENFGDYTEYGIDWEAAEDPALMDHLLERDEDEWNEVNPFLVTPATGPQRLSNVPCDPPNCPFTPWELQELDIHLAHAVDRGSRSMEVRRLVWIAALQIARNIMQRRS